MSLDEKLQHVTSRFDELNGLMARADALQPAEFARLSKEYSELSPIVHAIGQLRRAKAEAVDLETLLADPATDAEMREMARGELQDLKRLLPELHERIQILLLPKDAADEKNAIIEVRAGTGGEEAALFAADLFRMYQRYAELRGWQFEVMSINETGLGGYKEATATIAGQGVFARLKFESGVHRVQRVPETEASGRIHTSAATVAVLPEAEDVDVFVEEKDLRIDVYRSSGPGGQSVNTTDSAVRITHLPTGIVVSCQNEKSQLQNKEQAMRILRARLLAAAQEEADAAASAERRSQVRTVDRSERVRTYNFPDNRIADHRVGFKANNLDAVLDGDLDPVIQALVDADVAHRLAGRD
jgi:peptide chain release factor 1